MGDLPLSLQYQRIGGNVSPPVVANILREADTGIIYRLVDLANETRQKDGHLQSVLSKREDSLKTLDLVVEPFIERGEREASEASSEVAAFVEDALTGAVGDGFEYRNVDDLTGHLAGGIYHGHATAETKWDKDGGYLVPFGWKLHNQRRFRFRESDGRLVWWDWSAPTSTGGQGILLQEAFPGCFIQHAPRVNGDVPVREGLSRLLVWAGLFRNWNQYDWMQLAELAWKPYRYAKYGKNVDEKEINRLLRTLDTMVTRGFGAIREDHDLTFEFPNSGGAERSAHRGLADHLGSEMSKAVLGETLTTESGERGARSLGDVHDRVRIDKRSLDERDQRATLMRDLVPELVRLNFGPSAPMPLVRRKTEESADISSFGKGVAALANAGTRLPAIWVRDRVGAPHPEDDDEVIGGVVEDEEPESDGDEDESAPEADEGDPKDEDQDADE